MALRLTNASCQLTLHECEIELNYIRTTLKKIPSFDKQVPILTRYSIIRSTSAIEVVFKNLIADFSEVGANPQARNFIAKNFREKAVNLRYSMICRVLLEFDENWEKQFKNEIKKINSAARWTSSLDSLVEIRNEFAHGGMPTVSFNSVYTYFKHARRVMIVLERCIA